MEYKSYLKNMFRFNGRSRRREYWVVFLVNSALLSLIGTGLFYLYIRNHDPMSDAPPGAAISSMAEIMTTALAVLLAVWFLFTFVSTLALTVRRFHDVGIPGWAYAICLAGYLACGLGFLVQMILCLLPSCADNKFGVNPKKPERNAYKGKLSIIAAFTLWGISLIVSGAICVSHRFEALVLGIMKITAGKMYGVTTNCKVYSVDGMAGAYNYICKNHSDIYVYHKNAICKLDTMEELIQVEYLIGMACNDEVLYYATEENQGTLYCYDFTDGTNTKITDAYHIVEMTAHEDDIFVLQTERENYDYDTRGERAARSWHSYDVIYYHKKESGISLNEWAAAQEENESTDIYKLYSFVGYDIVEDTTIAGETPHIVYIEQEDGFGYSCYGYNTYGKADEEYVRFRYDGMSRYQGEEEETVLSRSNYYVGMTPSQIGFFPEQAWILEQYCKGTPGFQENPSKDFKVKDVVYQYEPMSGEFELLYETREKEQVAGFSYSRNCLYLLRNDGVYRRNLNTNKEELLFENHGYDTLSFEYFEDTLYIFKESDRDPDTLEEMPEELLFVEEG